MLKSEFDLKAKEYSASLGIAGPSGKAGLPISPEDEFRHRRIYAKSTLAVYMMDDLDLDSVHEDTMIRGQMRGDLIDQNTSNHPDGVHFSQGTDVFLRIKAEASDIRPFVQITVTADHIVSHGLNIPLTAKPIVFRLQGKEKPQSAQIPVTRPSPRTPIRREPSYENMQVVKKGVLVMLNTTEDTFVANATAANQPRGLGH
jgi:hypothetical protein